MQRKTLDDLIASDKAFLTPGDVCGVLRTTDQYVCVCAR